MQTINYGLKGRVKVAIINGNEVLHETPFQRNLILEQGLNTLAGVPLCNLFAVAAKGTGSSVTKETPVTTNKYSQTSGSLTVTRTAGTRNFTSGDVGKLIRFSNGFETKVLAFTDSTHVDTASAPVSTATNLTIDIYSISQTALDTEISRTSTYSSSANENSTTTVGNVRTFQRTFVFAEEEKYNELVEATGFYSQSGTNVTRDSGTRDFTAADVGRTINFVTTGDTAVIASITSTTIVVVTTSATVVSQNIRITGTTNFKETVAGTNTYSRTTTTLTRTAGTRNFTTGDIGKIVHFVNSNTECKITAFTDATHVTVDVSGTLTGENILLFGFTDYTEIGFSHSEEVAPNLNIRVLLASALRVYPATPLKLSDQVKVTYQLSVSVTPNTITAQNLNTIIVDSGNQMSGNKNGSNVIESFATSQVLTNGETDISFTDLEPFYDGFLALSLNTDALSPLSGKIRATGVAYVPMASDAYVQGSFFKTFTGIFGLTDAINTAWRSLMIFDPDTQSAVFTFLFTANQKKDGDHALTVTIRKGWSRDLS